MITLFVIVVIATLVLAVIRAEGMRPLGLALVGMISLVLGAGTTAIFTETSVAPFVNAMVMAQDDETTAVTAEDVAAKTEKSDSTKTSDKPAAQPQEAAETADPELADSVLADSELVDPATADEQQPAVEASDSVTDVADADEADTVQNGDTASVTDSGDATPNLKTPVTLEKITNIRYLDRGEEAPSWLEAKPWTEGGVYFVPVESRLQIEEIDCDIALQEQVKEQTNEYINRLLKNRHATTLLTLRSGLPKIHVTESFEERVVITDGSVCYMTHALLGFDDNFRSAVTTDWAEVRATSRLMQTGLGVGIVILLLSTMFSYFKLDTATRGYYTGRLQFAAAAAILTVIVASVLYANYSPWM
jgi:hypothetical protein